MVVNIRLDTRCDGQGHNNHHQAKNGSAVRTIQSTLMEMVSFSSRNYRICRLSHCWGIPRARDKQPSLQGTIRGIMGEGKDRGAATLGKTGFHA